MGVGSSRSDSATVRGAKSSRRREEKRDESARGVVEIQSPHNVQTSSGEYYSNEYRRRLRRRQEKARRLALLSSATRRAAQTEPKGDVCPAAMSESVATIPHRVMMEAPPSQTAAGAAPRTRQAPRRSASHDPHSRRRETNLPRLRDVDSYALYHHGGMVANWGYSQPGHDLYQRESCSRDCGGDNFMAVFHQPVASLFAVASRFARPPDQLPPKTPPSLPKS